MFPLWLVHTIAIIGLLIGSKTDLENREVPDMLNFILISLGIAMGASASVAFWTIKPLLWSVLGFGAGYLIGALMYYTGQWGGGDAKMLMGLGALQGVALYGAGSLLQGTIPLFFTTILTIFIAGAIYGLGYAFYLIARHRKAFRKEFLKEIHSRIKQRTFMIIIVILILASTFLFKIVVFKIALVGVAFMAFFGFYGLVMSKAIERAIMIKKVHTSKLVEGDWIVKDIMVGKKRICGPKDLGITEEQIALLKKHKIRSVVVKEGIPFIPGFLIGYIIVIIVGNWLIVVL